MQTKPGAKRFQSSDFVMIQRSLKTYIQSCLCRRRAWENHILSEPQSPPPHNEGNSCHVPDRLLKRFSEAPGLSVLHRAGASAPDGRAPALGETAGPRGGFHQLAKEALRTVSSRKGENSKHTFAFNFMGQSTINFLTSPSQISFFSLSLGFRR